MNAKRTWLKATALASILGLSLGITTPAEASIVDPAILFNGGNPITCTTTHGSTVGLGYDNGVDISGSPVNQTYNITIGGVVVGSVHVVPSSGGLDWTSTYPISAVIMKGGASANLYPYVQPPNSAAFPAVNWGARTYTGSVTADTDLNFPIGASHFEFCYQNDEQIIPPPPEITKTAETSWIQYHDWTLEKTSTPTWITMFNGDSHEADYVLHAEKSAYGVFTVSGVIEVTDPSHTYIVDSVADAIAFTGHAPIAMSTSCAAVDDGSDVIYRCTYSQSWSSKTPGFEYLAGGGGGQNSATAVVHYPGESNIDIGPATAPFSFSAEPDASYGDSLVVDDTFDEGDHTFTDTGDFNYTLTFTCPDDNGNHPNDVTGTFSTGENTTGEVISSAYVDVGCVDVTVEKTAQTSFDTDYTWTGDKKIVVRPEDLTKEEKSTYCSLISDASDPYVGNYVCDDITLILNEGSVYDTVYQLNATRSAANESGAKVFGTITVSWPTMSNPTFTGDPTDTLHFSDGQMPATQDAVVSNCVRDDVNLYITCDYSADLTSTRDGFNTASIVRQNLCYDAAGAEIACPAPAGTSSYTSDNVNFAFGDATTSTDECVALSDLFNAGGLNLGPTFSWTVDGNVCESTTRYVSDDVDPTAGVKDLTIHADWAPTGFENDACVFPVPNVLNLSTNDTQTTGSDEAVISVNVPSVCNQGCTLTQGYWKTHSKYGPAPYDSTWAVIGEDTLFFHSGYTWMNLFRTPPKGGNAYIQLAHQYMAARLNVEAGASTPSSVATALASATALFNAAGGVNSLTSAQITQARQLAGILGSYNEGAVGPGHCSESPTRKLTAKFLK